MKTLMIVLSVLLAAPAFAAENPLTDIKRIECHLTNRQGDHHTITPNVYENNGTVYAALSGYYTNSGGVQPRQDFFYETRFATLPDGTSHIQFFSSTTKFQNDRELNLLTKDFETGTLLQHVFFPGIGGKVPGGIPQSTFEDRVYDCQFIR